MKTLSTHRQVWDYISLIVPSDGNRSHDCLPTQYLCIGPTVKYVYTVVVRY